MKLSTQVWGLIAVVVCGAVLAAGWFLAVSPLLATQAMADKARRDAVVQNDSISADIKTLEAQKADLADYEARDAELEAAIPSGIEAAAFIRSLNDLALASNVQISALAFSDPSPYVAPAGDAADAEFAPNPATDARITGENFLVVPVNIEVKGGWNEVLAFTHGVQNGSRLVLVTTVNTTEDTGLFTTKLSGAMYVLVRTPVAAPAPDAAATDTAATEG
jgi:Tfp pilus assembly protein PilO